MSTITPEELVDIDLTADQLKAVETIKSRWAKVGPPTWILGGSGAVAVHVTGQSGVEMWLAVEPDGYTHS